MAANQGPHTPFGEVDLTTFEFVKAAFWYGGSAFQSMPPTEASGWQPTFVRDPSMTGGSGVPILMMYGTGEDNIVGSDQRGSATYEQWGPEDVDNKAFLVLEGLDHNGMTDEPITFHENPIPSTLPVATRASLVVDSLVVWLDTVLSHAQKLENGVALASSFSSDDDHYLDDFCREVVQVVGEENVDVCLPESVPDSDDSSDTAELGVQVGVPVAIYGTVMILLVVLYFRNRRQNRMSISHHDGAGPTASEGQKKNKEAADEEEGTFSNRKAAE